MRWALWALLALTGCESRPVPVAPCAALSTGCSATVNGTTVRARTNRPPAVLQPFEIEVDAPRAREVHVSLDMQGMDMGPNRYRLERAANGKWHARVTLPVCVSGRQDWLLVLDIDGERLAFPFVTS